MKNVGEAMAIGRTFKESLQTCLRSLERARLRRSPAAAHPSRLPHKIILTPHLHSRAATGLAHTVAIRNFGKLRRIGTEVYGDRAILARDVITIGNRPPIHQR
jgi:carbamoyl-phosphate synthase large subunit